MRRGALGVALALVLVPGSASAACTVIEDGTGDTGGWLTSNDPSIDIVAVTMETTDEHLVVGIEMVDLEDRQTPLADRRVYEVSWRESERIRFSVEAQHDAYGWSFAWSSDLSYGLHQTAGAIDANVITVPVPLDEFFRPVAGTLLDEIRASTSAQVPVWPFLFGIGFSGDHAPDEAPEEDIFETYALGTNC